MPALDFSIRKLAVQKCKILVYKEPQVHTIMLRQLSKKGYRIYPKVRLADAINVDRNERLHKRKFEYLSRAHLDFLVVTHDMPVFAVEFDGARHVNDPVVAERDVLKNQLCKDANLPLLRITSVEVTEQDQLTLLDYMLMRFVAWLEEIDGILQEIREYALDIPPDADPEILAIDLDPVFRFDLRHPFPGSHLVRKRLWRNYRIAWDADSINRQSSPRYLCGVNESRGGPLHHDQFHTCGVSVAVWSPESDPTSPLFTDNVEVTIRSWLPLATEVPEPDLSFFLRGNPKDLDSAVERFEMRVRSMWIPDIPGVSSWDISRNYAEYLGFRGIERWAKRALKADV